MFDYIKGMLAAVDYFNEKVVIENQDIGYSIEVSKAVLDTLPSTGEPIKLFVQFSVSERDVRLFGFNLEVEREFFRLICAQVKNVGPSTALRILGSGSIAKMKEAVLRGETEIFRSVKGVGAKTAARIVNELKDYIGALDTSLIEGDTRSSYDYNTRSDAIKTLVSLGFSENTAVEKIDHVLKTIDSESTLEEVVKLALLPR